MDGDSSRIVETWDLRDPECLFVMVGRGQWDIAYKPEYVSGGGDGQA